MFLFYAIISVSILINSKHKHKPEIGQSGNGFGRKQTATIVPLMVFIEMAIEYVPLSSHVLAKFFFFLADPETTGPQAH